MQAGWPFVIFDIFDAPGRAPKVCEKKSLFNTMFMDLWILWQFVNLAKQFVILPEYSDSLF